MDFFRDSAKLPAAECLKPLVGEPHHETRRTSYCTGAEGERNGVASSAFSPSLGDFVGLSAAGTGMSSASPSGLSSAVLSAPCSSSASDGGKN